MAARHPGVRLAMEFFLAVFESRIMHDGLSEGASTRSLH